MMLTIIPSDRFVNIDGFAINFDFTVDTNYHAIHWDGDNGFIETIIGNNILLTDIEDFTHIVSAHAVEKEKLLKEEERFIANQLKPINIWKQEISSTDSTMPRYIEELIDALDSSGVPIKLNMPKEFRDTYEHKKDVRSRKPKENQGEI